MVKGISAINSIAKKGVLGLMLASSVTMGASSPIKNTRAENEPPKTEVMSKEASEALKLNSLQQTQQSVPTVHNNNLDNNLRRFILNNDDKVEVDKLLNYVYDNVGTYQASVLLQLLIESNKLENFLDGNETILDRFTDRNTREYKTAKQPFMEPLYKDKDKIYNYFVNNIEQNIINYFTFDHKPTFKEVMARINSYEDTRCGDDMACYIEYKYYVMTTDTLLSKKNTVEAKSECIALLIHNSIFESIINYLTANYPHFKDLDCRKYYIMWMQQNSPEFPKVV